MKNPNTRNTKFWKRCGATGAHLLLMELQSGKAASQDGLMIFKNLTNLPLEKAVTLLGDYLIWVENQCP